MPSLPAQPVATLSGNALGSLYMVAGSLGYVTNDALVRAAADSGMSVFQALFLRGVAMSVVLSAATRGSGISLADVARQRPVLIRVAAEVLAAATFFAALVNLEFANAQTILMLVPFAVTLVAARWLGEQVSGRQFLIILIGLAGVVAVIQPATDEFSRWSIVVVLSAAILVVREVATAGVATSTPTLPIALLTAVALTALTGIITVAEGWTRPDDTALIYLAGACLLLTAAYFFTIQAVRVGDLSVSAPFRYTAVVGAVVIGYVGFDEVPSWLTVLGCVVIIISGGYSTMLDRRNRRRHPATRYR